MTRKMALRLAEQHKRIHVAATERRHKRHTSPIMYMQDSARFVYDDGTPVGADDPRLARLREREEWVDGYRRRSGNWPG